MSMMKELHSMNRTSNIISSFVDERDEIEKQAFIKKTIDAGKRALGSLKTTADASKRALQKGRTGLIGSDATFVKGSKLSNPQSVSSLDDLAQMDDLANLKVQTTTKDGVKTTMGAEDLLGKVRAAETAAPELKQITQGMGLSDDITKAVEQKVGEGLSQQQAIKEAMQQRYTDLSNKFQIATGKEKAAIGLEILQLESAAGAKRGLFDLGRKPLSPTELSAALDKNVSTGIEAATKNAQQEAVAAVKAEFGIGGGNINIGKNVEEVVMLNPNAATPLTAPEMLTYAGSNALGFAGANAETIAKAGVYGGMALGSYGLYKLLT